MVKVVQLGNVANLAFNYAKYLRKDGIECDLVVSGDPTDLEVPPENHDWVKFWNPKNPVTTLFTLWKLTRRYDVIHAHGGRCIYAFFLGKPFIAHSMGSDLRLYAVQNTPLGILLRTAFKKCNKFFFSSPDQLGLIEKMGLDAEFVFQIIDTEKFAPEQKRTANDRLTFFYPTRHSWTTKGNDKFFKAFARFLKTCPDARLVATYWDIHKEKSRELVQQLGIGANVEFVDRMSAPELIRWYRQADVVADEFNIGSFGLVALEAMACGKPVLRFIDEKLHLRYYADVPPIANASTEEEIYQKLLQLMDVTYRESLGNRARVFVLKYHHWKPITQKLIRQYRALAPGAIL